MEMSRLRLQSTARFLSTSAHIIFHVRIYFNFKTENGHFDFLKQCGASAGLNVYMKVRWWIINIFIPEYCRLFVL